MQDTSGRFQDIDGRSPDVDGSFQDVDGSFPDIDGGFPDIDGGFPDIDGGFRGIVGRSQEVAGGLKENVADLYNAARQGIVTRKTIFKTPINMKKQAIYYPRMEGEVLTYYNTVVTQLTPLAAKYGVDQNTLTLLSAHAGDLLATKQKAEGDQELAKASVLVKNQKFAQARVDLLRELSRITSLPNFDEADAMAAGIRRSIEDENNSAKLIMSKPMVTNIVATPDAIIIDWVKGKMDGVVIFASEDGASFTEIGMDLRSPFEDKRRNKTNQPEMRYYRLRYLLKDAQVGEFSDTYQEVANIQK